MIKNNLLINFINKKIYGYICSFDDVRLWTGANLFKIGLDCDFIDMNDNLLPMLCDDFDSIIKYIKNYNEDEIDKLIDDIMTNSDDYYTFTDASIDFIDYLLNNNEVSKYSNDVIIFKFVDYDTEYIKDASLKIDHICKNILITNDNIANAFITKIPDVEIIIYIYENIIYKDNGNDKDDKNLHYIGTK